MEAPLLSIIYVYFNTPHEISASIESIKKNISKNFNFEIIIVDNNSSFPLPKQIIKHKEVKIIRNKKNIGYGAGLNTGVKVANGKFFLCTNTDTIYQKGAIEKLYEKMENDKSIGVVGPQMINTNKKRLDTASKYPLFPINIFLFTFLKYFFPKVEKKYHYRDRKISETEVDAVGGACMLFRRESFERVNGFDKQFFLYFEEADICKRIRESGYKVVYYPKSVITHLVGKSSSDKAFIKTHFEKSRFLFIRKHQSKASAFLSESLIRFLNPTVFLLIGIVAFSLFFNLYKITSLMMFYGDYGRDMLVAKEMVLTGQIPLLGIPSSVVWLSQGPLSIYMIGLSFLISGFSPFAPAIFYAVLGSMTCFIVYKLGKQLFNKNTGFIAALLFACSPFVIVNARIPYHTAPIPFFSAMFFLNLYLFIKKRTIKFLILSGLLLGLLFQLELSNGVLFFLLPLLLFIYKIKVTRKEIGLFIGSFSIGIFPFILYDLTHTFIQTAGFVAWVGNRIRLFFGLTISGISTTAHLPEAFQIIGENLVRFVFPPNQYIAYSVLFISAVCVFAMIAKKKNKDYLFILLSVGIPFLGFAVHARPGMAYFPLVFPLLAVVIAYGFHTFIRFNRLFLVFFFLVIFVNSYFVLSNSYFLDINGQKGTAIRDWNYGLGVSLGEQQKVSGFLKKESEKFPIQIKPGGFLKDFPTSIDNYRYLLWYEGVKQKKNGKVYVLYEERKEIPMDEAIVFKTNNVIITTP